MENWKEIVGYDKYHVSSLGRIKSLNKGRCKILSPEKTRAGYLRVSLCKQGIIKRFQVHRVIAESFIDNPENKKYVNHKNGNKADNRLSNLEWCTASENEKHSYAFLKKTNPIRKLTEQAVNDIRSNAIKGTNQNNRGNVSDFMHKYRVSRHTILSVIDFEYYAA